MSDEAPGLSYRHAATRIGRSRRTIQRLVKAGGRLQTIGSGQGRRVTIASIEKYLADERETFRDMTGDSIWTVSPVSEYKRLVEQKIKKLPALTSPLDAAKLLGIPRVDVEALIASKGIPSIPIGTKLFIPKFWLVGVLNEAAGAGQASRLRG